MSGKPEVAGEMIKIGLLDRYMAISGKTPKGLDGIAYLPMEPILRWCAFCAVLLRLNYVNSATELLHDLHLDGKTIKTCLRALEITEFPGDWIVIKQLLAKYGAAVVRCAAAVCRVLYGRDALEYTDKILASGECVTLSELTVAGRDLIEMGHPSGCELGETLGKLLEHVIRKPEDNNRETLLSLVETINV
jgi:hypothetical protein